MLFQDKYILKTQSQFETTYQTWHKLGKRDCNPY
jgi:hypothetical protein